MPSPVQNLLQRFVVEPVVPFAEVGPRTVSVRIPVEPLATIDALAENASCSRNQMLLELLNVGISELFAQMPDPIRDEIEAGKAARLRDFEGAV